MNAPTAPGGPTDPDDTSPVPGDGVLDDLDALVLDRLDVLHTRLDGPPADFTDLMVFAVAAHGLDVELARLQEGALAARADEEVTRSLTFEADSLSVLLRVADTGEDRVRLDGWVAPAEQVRVELRSPGGGTDRRVDSDDDGRFVVDAMPRGLVQLVVRRESLGPVVTPTFEL